MPGEPDTRTRLLDAANRIIESAGERALRLRDVAREVGISEPTIYHYFSDRDSLIVAALASRYKAELAVTVDPFLPAVRECKSREEFVTILQRVFIESYKPERTSVRTTRVDMVVSAFRHEQLRHEVRAAMVESLAPSMEALRYAQLKGWLRPDIDPEAFGILNLSLISSRIFPELLGDVDLLVKWDQLTIQAITALLNHQS